MANHIAQFYQRLAKETCSSQRNERRARPSKTLSVTSFDGHTNHRDSPRNERCCSHDNTGFRKIFAFTLFNFTKYQITNSKDIYCFKERPNFEAEGDFENIAVAMTRLPQASYCRTNCCKHWNQPRYSVPIESHSTPTILVWPVIYNDAYTAANSQYVGIDHTTYNVKTENDL
ncbi:hypothetical protein J6590_005577 [Homalodisca vitripennis]|nr:hypothetical protein J6590_005577 [Homalodisca vitripennis]